MIDVIRREVNNLTLNKVNHSQNKEVLVSARVLFFSWQNIDELFLDIYKSIL